jgi:hypothetical protein
VRKRILALNYFIPSLYHPPFCHERGSCRFHYSCIPDDLTYVDDAESLLSRSQRPCLNHHSKPVLLGWGANVNLQPVLDRNAAIKYSSKCASRPETDGYRLALDDFCAHYVSRPPCRKCGSASLRRDDRRHISTQEDVHPPARQPSCRRTTLTQRSQTTRLVMTTLPLRHPSVPATKHAQPLRRT